MDPFVLIEFGGSKYRTKVVDGGGTAPKWNDKFEFEIKKMEEIIKVSCFDEDIFNNDLIGDVQFAVKHLCTEKETRKWLPLKFN